MGNNIINTSFGLSEYSNALEQAVKNAKAAGILIIAAAGNTGDKGVVYPAALEEVEIVAPGELIGTTGFLFSYWNYPDIQHAVRCAHLLCELTGIDENHPDQKWASAFIARI